MTDGRGVSDPAIERRRGERASEAHSSPLSLSRLRTTSHRANMKKRRVFTPEGGGLRRTYTSAERAACGPAAGYLTKWRSEGTEELLLAAGGGGSGTGWAKRKAIFRRRLSRR